MQQHRFLFTLPHYIIKTFNESCHCAVRNLVVTISKTKINGYNLLGSKQVKGEFNGRV